MRCIPQDLHSKYSKHCTKLIHVIALKKFCLLLLIYAVAISTTTITTNVQLQQQPKITNNTVFYIPQHVVLFCISSTRVFAHLFIFIIYFWWVARFWWCLLLGFRHTPPLPPNYYLLLLIPHTITKWNLQFVAFWCCGRKICCYLIFASVRKIPKNSGILCNKFRNLEISLQPNNQHPLAYNTFILVGFYSVKHQI